MYGDAATKENGFAFDYLPKVDRDCSWTHIWDDMYNGKIKGMLAFGMNGVMIGPDTNKNINALKKADWLVVGEIYPGRNQRVLESSGNYGRRTEDHQYHGVPAALRGLRGKRRKHDELGPLGNLEDMPRFRLQDKRGSTRTSSRRFSCASAICTRKRAENSLIPF